MLYYELSWKKSLDHLDIGPAFIDIADTPLLSMLLPL
jgi:hypothetical protein